jgi:hypothetical protein
MHAVVTKVKISDVNAAQSRLNDEVVPRVSGAPGFVTAHWVRLSDEEGVSLMVFESEDAARGAAQGIQAQGGDGAVSFERIDVGEVVANA